jgi:hypothetical protein
LSETIESQRLVCVCGKKLRIPANASTKAKAGNCPKCQAPFEFRDGEWICVAVQASTSTSPKPSQPLRDRPPAANLASMADEQIVPSQVAQAVSHVTAASQYQDDKPLSHGSTTENAISTISNDVTDSLAGQQGAVEAQRLYSTPGVAEEVLSNGRVLEAAYAGLSYLEHQSITDDTFSKRSCGSEVVERYLPKTFRTDPPHPDEDVMGGASGLETGCEDLTEPADNEASLSKLFAREQTSLQQLEDEPSALPSTAEPNCESNANSHVSTSSSTKSHEIDGFSETIINSFAPAITAELAVDYYFDEGPSSQPPVDIQRIESQPVADDVQAEQPHSGINGTALVDEGTTEEQSRPNQKIRASLATSLVIDQQYPEQVVAAITLACHPWPDFAISQNDIDSIAAELRPGFNINHPSMLEIAVDRLLRFEDALLFNGSKALASMYANAASTLESYQGDAGGDRRFDVLINKNFGIVASPTGLVNSRTNFMSALTNDHTQKITDDWHSTIISFLGAAVFRGSHDTGIALGSEATGVSVSCLAEELGVELPEKQFDKYLDKLDNRTSDILTSRTFKLGLPDTLEDIATRWNVTRERIRQIETKAGNKLRDRFTETFKRLGKQTISPLSCHVIQIDVLYANATRIAGCSRHREILSGFLADIFGPWQKAGHWIYHSSLKDRVEQLRSSLVEQSDPYGIIASNSIEIGCGGLFLTELDRDQFLKEEFGFGHYFGIWTCKNTMRCQVAAALRKIGRPATKEELAELLEHPTQSVGSVLGNIEGIVRADRYRWGFDEWVEDAYDGIYAEIEQRINEYNGSVPIHVLMSEIPAQFDVAESSVKAYLASSAFVVDNGMVRIASNEDYTPRSPSRCADAIRIGDRWGYRSLIYDRHFNGYSLGVNFDVAFANGLRPGDDLVVPVEGSEEEVSLIWRLKNLNRLVDVGRVTNYLISKGYKTGETLILIPSREKIEIVHERELQTLFPESNVQMKFDTFSEGNQSKDNTSSEVVFDPLLDLLGGDQ